MLKKLLLTYSLFFIAFQHNAQQNFISLNGFYKDKLYHSTHRLEGYSGNSFFPVNEDQYNLNYKIADTTKLYYTETEILFKKHLLEFKGENYYLTISPVLDFTYSRDIEDTLKRKLYQNSRGFLVEGDLFKNFSFSTSFYENQSRNPLYQSNYYRSLGELYVKKADSSYISANAVMPGAGRTKVFKIDAFDYAYAIGNIIYKPFKVLTLSAGNNQHFIGDGYRSMLLSDNSYSSPYFQANYRFLPKWEFVYLRSRLMNLLRKPASTSVEAYYEPKGYAVNYLSFKANKKLTISLFEGTIYSRGDSIVSKSANPLFYNPVPIIGAFLLNEQEINSILGLNIGFSATNYLRIYGQFAFNNKTNGTAGQLGFRFSEPFKIKQLFLQLEANYASNEVYSSQVSRLNYSHYNLPLAHPKGQGFVEGVLRANYEWKRAYIDLKSIYYSLTDYSQVSLLPTKKIVPLVTGTIFHNELEIGYRFNRKLNLILFGNWLLRSDSFSANKLTNMISIGLKTNLLNHYSDF